MVWSEPGTRAWISSDVMKRYSETSRTMFSSRDWRMSGGLPKRCRRKRGRRGRTAGTFIASLTEALYLVWTTFCFRRFREGGQFFSALFDFEGHGVYRLH